MQWRLKLQAVMIIQESAVMMCVILPLVAFSIGECLKPSFVECTNKADFHRIVYRPCWRPLSRAVLIRVRIRERHFKMLWVKRTHRVVGGSFFVRQNERYAAPFGVHQVCGWCKMSETAPEWLLPGTTDKRFTGYMLIMQPHCSLHRMVSVCLSQFWFKVFFKSLHWLPVCRKIDFKILLLVHQELNVLRTEHIWFTCMALGGAMESPGHTHTQSCRIVNIFTWCKLI